MLLSLPRFNPKAGFVPCHLCDARQDGIDHFGGRDVLGAVLGVVEGECALAGSFEALGAEAPGESDHALCGPQVVEDAVSQQTLDEGVTGRTDVFALT